MKLVVFETKSEIAKLVSTIIIETIKENQKLVLGLATGSSPIDTYDLLIKDYQKNHTDWSQVTTFNLDEYVGLAPEHKKSYRYFMNEQLFNKINIKKENTYVPNGLGNVTANAQAYEKLLVEKGPINLQILGIGTNGHIAFNEPGTSGDSKTHVVDLTTATIEANKRFFASVKDVPTKAITMGVDSILQAQAIILIADGQAKAQAIYELVHGKITPDYPCSYLQAHDNVMVIIDSAAASLLKPPTIQPKN
ncbi:glucosamine-6-phosphate deaminase [Spiroplasma endosymbiont of Virgichneumon dumeticola]|uniref:glucosamine-6-phosphate deaminase n=1 Tax=Spiroplasma endosymbiont of Virgichneumon dumeticola TaxID=3139323 RepID=UPI0035C8EE66